MGLKLSRAGEFKDNPYILKSDQNGVEIYGLDMHIFGFGSLKSDQNGVEIYKTTALGTGCGED